MSQYSWFTVYFFTSILYYLYSTTKYINPVGLSNALTHPHDKSGGFQFIQRTLDRHRAAEQDCGNGCDRKADKQDSVLVFLPFGEHSVQNPAVHDLCGAADRKSCQRSGKYVNCVLPLSFHFYTGSIWK